VWRVGIRESDGAERKIAEWEQRGSRSYRNRLEHGVAMEWLFCRSHALVTTMYAKHFILTRGGQTFPHDIDLALCMCA